MTIVKKTTTEAGGYTIADGLQHASRTGAEEIATEPSPVAALADQR